MADAGLDSFFAELASEGQAQGAAAFTLESSKAREKLRKFALEHPENYVLMLVGGLVALGGRQFSVTVDADDFVLDSDARLNRKAFEDLWLYVAGGKGKGDALGFRLLAIAILTSVRFSKMDWSVQSQDSEGAWVFRTSVAQGQIGAEKLESDPEPVEGVRIWAKRKSLSQVTHRFLANLTRKVFRRRCPEEALLEERVCLPATGQLAINGRESLSAESGRGEAVAVLTSGGSPALARASHHFVYKKDHTITTVLVEAKNREVLGEGRKLQWVWNGLLMEQEDLDMPYDFCRAVVWAPELRVDMSFSALVDSREKSRLVRCARDSVREMLKLYALEMTESLQKEKLEPALEWGRRRLLEVVAERIDTRKDLRRFGSFNRALVNCPLFWGSDADGSERRYTMAELWTRLLEKKPIATFQNEEEWRRVAAWPDRPLVLFTDREERRLLEKKFGKASLASAETLARNLERMRVGSSPLTRPKAEEVAVQGRFEHDGVSVEWYARSRGGGSFPWGSIRIHQAEQLRFEDQSLPLWGILLIAETDWAADHQGRVKDRELVEALSARVLTELARDVSSHRDPGPRELWLGSIILESLKELTQEAGLALRDLPWIVCRTVAGERVLSSPKELLKLCESSGAPLYLVEPGADAGLSEVPEEWKPLRLPEVSSEARSGLEKLLGLEFRSARGLKILSGSEPAQVEEKAVAVERLEFDLPPGVQRVTLHWPHRSNIRRSLSVVTSSFGRGLEQLFDVATLPALMEVEWSAGWPDGTGLRIANKDQRKALEESFPQLLTRFSERFLSSATPAQLRELRPQALSYAVSACLDDDPILVRGDYRTARPQEIEPIEGVVRYFTSPAGFGAVPREAIFAPGEYAEYLPLLPIEADWVEVTGEEPVAFEPEEAAETRETEAEGSEPQAEPEPEPEAVSSSEPVLKEEPEAASIPIPEPEPVPVHPVAPEPVALSPEPKEPEEPAEPAASEALPSESSPSEQRAPAEPEDLLAPVLSPVRALQEELLSWSYQNRIPYREEFLEFLNTVELDEASPVIVSLRQGRPVLGAPWLARSQEPEVRLASLSALYSLFNRSREEVEDQHERRFHRMLLQRSLKLWPGMSFS